MKLLDMRSKVFNLIAAILIVSCATTNRIIDTQDDFKGVSGFKLIQTPKARWADTNSYGELNVKLNYIYEESKNSSPILRIDVQLTSSFRTSELDSIMFFDLDNEKIKIVSKNYCSEQLKSPQTNSDQLTGRNFEVLQNLWVPIVHTENIRMILYLKGKGIEVEPNQSENEKIREFLKRAIHQRDASLPPPPEGLKKL